MKKLAVVFSAVCILAACGIHIPPNPNPNPTPKPTPTPTAGYDNNRTLRTAGTHLTLLDGTPFNLDMGVQCCDAVPEVANSLWPCQSEDQMAFFQKYSLNAGHCRLGPFYGDADHESEWSDIGGAYLGNPGQTPTLQFNPQFDAKVVALMQYAYDHKMWIEINIIDTWYCKRASTKQGFHDQQMPWPQADIDACGIDMTPVQEQFLRHFVKLLGKFPNILWATDNEGSNIRGTKAQWYIDSYNIIRSEENANGYPIHIVGVDNEDIQGPFEYVSTHARAGLLAPLQGKFSLNNERNPEFQPDQEINNFKQARDLGLSYAFWRAGMTNEAVYQTLQGFQAVITGSHPPITGCYAPASEDPLWDTNPTSPTGPKDRSAFNPEPGTREAVASAKSALGPMTGAGHDAMLQALAQKLRDDGWCASKASDSVMMMSQTNKNVGYEFHAVNYTDDTWSTQDKVNPKMKWTYLGQVAGAPPATSACTDPQPPAQDHWNMKVHNQGPNWTTLDATPIIHDAQYCSAAGFPGNLDCPLRAENDPSRAACETKVVGGDPIWSGPGEVSPEGPYLYRVRRGTTGVAKVCNHFGVCGEISVPA